MEYLKIVFILIIGMQVAAYSQDTITDTRVFQETFGAYRAFI